MTPEMFAEYQLPPGPAFIVERELVGWWNPDGKGQVPLWRYNECPPGYVWQPATDSTPAGWVRPHGKLDR